MTDRPLGAQISHMLKDRGTEVIFGIPGVHNQEMYRGIEEAGMTHILARHEQGAGFMADGYARATGKPGVCYVITGPGVCNILTPMGQAYSDSVPVLVVSSCLDDVAGKRGQLHQMRDQEAAAAAVCDWSATATSPQATYQLIDRALDEFKSQRPRSKHIQVPIAQLMDRAPAADRRRTTAPTPPSAPTSIAQTVASCLAGAQRPLFIVGGGCVGAAKAGATLAEALDKFQAAAFVSYAGRGCVSPEYPLFLGSYLARPSSDQVIAKSDVVIVLGCNLDEVDIWRETVDFAHDATVVRVDIDPEVLANDARADHKALGTVEQFLADMIATDVMAETQWTEAEVATQRRQWRQEIEAERPNLLSAIDALRDALPDNTMIYSDMTQFAYAAKEIWDMPHPAHWHHPTGFGTLGYAVPAAIGGKIGMSGAPVVAIAGDYGFQYSLQDLIVATEHKLSLPIILWDNDKLGEIEASMVAAQIAPNAVEQQNPDFGLLAQAYGARFEQPDTLGDIAAAVDRALSFDGPTLIHLRASTLFSAT